MIDAPSPPVLRDLARRQIERALGGRTRYRYVRPRVEAEGDGWAVFSPNCSRRVDAAGGDIPIAWLRLGDDGAWVLHARDHAARSWIPRQRAARLAEVLGLLLRDPQREYWP